MLKQILMLWGAEILLCWYTPLKNVNDSTLCQARQDLEEWGKYSKKEKEQRIESNDFDSDNEYLDFLNEHRISLDDLNEYLMLI